MKFIEVTLAATQSVKIYINSEMILKFNKSQYGNYTCVYWGNDNDPINIKETPEELLELINEQPKPKSTKSLLTEAEIEMLMETGKTKHEKTLY